MSYTDVAKKIAKEITKQYPKLNIYYDYYDNDEELFILIDNETIFDTSEYRKMIKSLRQATKYNVFFSCIYSNDELTEHAVNLTEENIKDSLKSFIFNDESYVVKTTIILQQLIKQNYDIEDMQIMQNGMFKSFKNHNIEDKEIVPNSMLKPFMGFSKGDFSCQNSKVA